MKTFTGHVMSGSFMCPGPEYIVSTTAETSEEALERLSRVHPWKVVTDLYEGSTCQGMDLLPELEQKQAAE